MRRVRRVGGTARILGRKRLAWALALAFAGAGEAAAATRPAESLLIVDCLLPGKVQRLGTQATYVTQRRAVKTTAGDCAVRGGEYTAFDRATTAASMNVWLPAARAGDPEAQTNVGEILEKGVGGQAQPDLARQWYELAAEQGYARAQINLGSLYERGVGVPRDVAKALEWYRRASGLDAASLSFAPGEEVEGLRRERDALAGLLEAERAERGRLQQDLDAVRQRLERDRSVLGETERRLADAQRELAARTAAVEVETRRAGTAVTAQQSASAELAAMRREMEAQRQVVEARNAELARARASVAELEARSRTLQTDLAAAEARRATDVAGALSQAEAARRQLGELGARLKAAEGELGRSLEAMSAQRAEVERLRAALDDSRGRTQSGDGRRAELEAQLAAREAELAESRERLGTLNGEVARLEKEASVLRESARRAEAAREEAARLAAATEQKPVAVRTAQPGVIRPPPDFSFGRYHALIIGNNSYRHLERLETAVNDARAVDDVLRRRYGFKTTLLLNADRYQLLSALNKLREELTAQDNLLIYYAGHGELDRVNNRGYWLPVDAELNSTANWISSIQITDVLNAMTAKQVLLVADSCYSGVLTRASMARLEAGLTEEERMRWLKAMATKRARVVLTSGGVQPVLDGGGGEHSVFAAAFLAALEANQGVMESQRLAQRVVQQVTTSAAGASIDQIPVYAPIRFAGHEAGDFFFVTKN
ncbi:MAG: caspase family protein [Phenylobacterium sp.]|uniref:caspase family protein n=1 Tax=Phenylobacterium sp. TaxID=1871053 RepID=UPI001A3DF01C|nr:caspase family protein [Phenylobacterium sp.]MBL8772627.1 caspase family protein [Phenylobacterium sp.]